MSQKNLLKIFFFRRVRIFSPPTPIHDSLRAGNIGTHIPPKKFRTCTESDDEERTLMSAHTEENRREEGGDKMSEEPEKKDGVTVHRRAKVRDERGLQFETLVNDTAATRMTLSRLESSVEGLSKDMLALTRTISQDACDVRSKLTKRKHKYGSGRSTWCECLCRWCFVIWIIVVIVLTVTVVATYRSSSLKHGAISPPSRISKVTPN